MGEESGDGWVVRGGQGGDGERVGERSGGGEDGRVVGGGVAGGRRASK